MKYILIALLALSANLSAQSFDFSCNQVPDGVYKANSDEFYYVENDRLLWVIYRGWYVDNENNRQYCWNKQYDSPSLLLSMISSVTIASSDTDDYRIIFSRTIDYRTHNFWVRTLGKEDPDDVGVYEIANDLNNRCPNQ